MDVAEDIVGLSVPFVAGIAGGVVDAIVTLHPLEEPPDSLRVHRWRQAIGVSARFVEIAMREAQPERGGEPEAAVGSAELHAHPQQAGGIQLPGEQHEREHGAADAYAMPQVEEGPVGHVLPKRARNQLLRARFSRMVSDEHVHGPADVPKQRLRCGVESLDFAHAVHGILQRAPARRRAAQAIIAVHGSEISDELERRIRRKIEFHGMIPPSRRKLTQ